MMGVPLLILGVGFFAVAIVAGAFIVRKMSHGVGFAALFAPNSVKRIDIVEQLAIDAKRKLVLVRRDDVEHLLMTGGPADIVIESGIGAPSSGEARTPSTLPLRSPRTLGQAAGDR
jgi:hypothetical protein